MLKVESVTKQFGGKVILKGVSFEVNKNQVVGLLGPNGAGKTTLMRVIVGFLSATQGKITWDKKEVDWQDREFKSKVGYLPENNPLYPSLTVKEYLRFVAELKNLNKTNLTDQIREVAKECGIEEVTDKKIEILSKGYKQRVGLAAALLGNPQLLILDEPTTGLDPNQIIEIRKLIKKLAKERMIVLSTHILPEAKEVCQKLLIISEGKIVLDEETSKIKNLEKKFVELTV